MLVKSRAIFASLFVSFSTLSSANAMAAPLSTEVVAFVDEMVSKHNVSRERLISTLEKANKNEDVLSAIARPWEAKPWYQYRPIFITDARIEKGLTFWKEHQPLLTEIEKKTGVDAAIIVAIIGVETYYGKFKGKYSVLDALYSLAFHYPPRSKFFRSELAQLFLLTEEEDLSIFELKGSYAGAMGWGQFISSSYRHYAVDHNGDGKRDLLNSPEDAIASVANYFVEHGWQANAPVAFPVTALPDDPAPLLRDNLKYNQQWKELKANGVDVIAPYAIDENTPVKLFKFEHKSHEAYWLGLKNFYVITRYNHSPLYAMAVYQLSEKIKAKMQ
ncbi:lytic murein transglycosylase B [Aestuariibacter sp. AA17]|uniref:Lytic murein transglycosylase B n=1 Tax=Fluctibacter corallii TaxID=2984329 RepID=A0ABT3A5R3_9ALTE|nr:lytic murein transglycosylase B [Aestuariibacter sp. AA17]MCV2883970.1 lytic murein transglycosylase B [Aestuariibacter sp. AA17]